MVIDNSAIRAIREGRKLTFKEEYSIESLWHEMRHAAAVGWKDIKKKNSELSNVMEAVNQFCARRTYGHLLEALGGKANNTKQIISMGYGYRTYVKNLEKIFEHYNISTSVAHNYLKDKIITIPYEDIFETVTEYLTLHGAERETAKMLLKNIRKSRIYFINLITDV